MTNKTETFDYHKYHVDRIMPFIGAKIISVIVDSDDAPDVYCGFILQLQDGTKKELVFYSDPEGNGPGHISINKVP